MMEINQGVPVTGTLSQLNAQWPLVAANTGDGLRFQQSFRIELPSGGFAETLHIDASTGLRLQTTHLIFNALSSTAPERAQVSKRDNHTLQVKLPVPRIIHSIRFTSSSGAGGKTTQLLRGDGDVISDAPVASHNNLFGVIQMGSGGKAPVSKSFFSGAGSVAPGLQEEVRNQAQLTSARTTRSPPHGDFGVVDGAINVRLVDGNSPQALSRDSLSEFNLSTGPESLRVGLRLPDLGDELFYLPLAFALNQSVNAASELQTQLQNLVGRLTDALRTATPDGPPPPLPNPLALDLVVESDAPCGFSLSQFAIRYRLGRQSLPGGEPKQVLRFSGEQPQNRRLALQLPPSATLASALLRVSGRGGDPGASASHTNTFQNLLLLGSDSGLRLDTRHRWSSPMVLHAPSLVAGCDLLLSNLQQETLLHLQLTVDRNGAPGGERLAGAEEILQQPGASRPVRFSFDKPLPLQAGTYWLQLESRSGSAVWLLQSQAGSRSLSWPAQSGTTPGQTVEDQIGIAQWLPASGSVHDNGGVPEIRVGDQVLGVVRDGRDWIYDLGAALHGTTPSGSGLLAAELVIMAVGGTPVTIYPPQVLYEVWL